ncbi:hypothetical protein ACP4OV_016166 [Aristida adscensionis]
MQTRFLSRKMGEVGILDFVGATKQGLIENPIVSGSPDTPRHDDYNLHEERNLQLIFEPYKGLQRRPGSVDIQTNRFPAGSCKIASGL